MKMQKYPKLKNCRIVNVNHPEGMDMVKLIDKRSADLIEIDGDHVVDQRNNHCTIVHRVYLRISL